MSDLKQLLIDRNINKFEYDSYVLFELTELGRIYLSNMIESKFLEHSESMQIEHTFVWHDGRRSEWREIKMAIIKINNLLKDMEDDRKVAEFDRSSDKSATGRASYSGSIPFGDID